MEASLRMQITVRAPLASELASEKHSSTIAGNASWCCSARDAGDAEMQHGNAETLKNDHNVPPTQTNSCPQPDRNQVRAGGLAPSTTKMVDSA